MEESVARCSDTRLGNKSVASTEDIFGDFREDNISSASRAPSTEAFGNLQNPVRLLTGETDIWRAIQSLEDLGLLVEIPHLVENSSLTCEPIHGLSWDGEGEPAEQELAIAALAAGSLFVEQDALPQVFPRSDDSRSGMGHLTRCAIDRSFSSSLSTSDVPDGRLVPAAYGEMPQST